MAAVENGHANRAKKRAKPPRDAVYFLSLQLRNARCFGDQPQTLDLSDGAGKPARWTILLGNNGTGKTTVLQSLVAFELTTNLGDEKPKTPRAFDRRLSNYWDGFIRFRKGTTLLLAQVARGSGLTATSADFQSRNSSISFVRSGTKEGRIRKEAYVHMTQSVLCFAYGAGRRLGRSSLIGSETDDPAMSLFLEDFELLNAEEWLLRLDYSASKPSDIQKRQQNRLEQVKELLVNILPDVTDIRLVSPTKRRPDPAVEFKTPYGWVKLGHLGYGYRTLIAWMVDFASRMVDRYPDSPDPLAEPAVVLVDEIDLHLHPTWQRTLIGYLTIRFPNTPSAKDLTRMRGAAFSISPPQSCRAAPTRTQPPRRSTLPVAHSIPARLDARRAAAAK